MQPRCINQTAFLVNVPALLQCKGTLDHAVQQLMIRSSYAAVDADHVYSSACKAFRVDQEETAGFWRINQTASRK